MHKFDYSLLQKGLLPAGLLNITTDIYSLRVMALDRKEKHIDVFTELESIAKVQSVKSSNELEGIVTTDERIHEIVNGNSAPLNHSEQEIAGYRDALAEVHTGYGDMDFRRSDILRLHSIMMNIAGYSYAGKYKEYDNDIIEEDRNGRRRVRFRPTPAADTPDEMEQLELAYMEARDNPNTNQLLLIPCVMTVLNSLTPISKADIGRILPDVSATTIEAVLGQMVRTGSIRKVGSGRGTKYVRS